MKPRLKLPFKILFREEIIGTQNKTIIENFKANFKKTFCDHILINADKELVIKNNFIRWKPDSFWNFWDGIRNARVTIIENSDKKKKTIEYSIDYTYWIVRNIFIIIIIMFLFKIIGLFTFLSTISDLLVTQSLKFVIIFSGLLLVIMFFISVLRHRSLFKRTIKFGVTNDLGNYDWDTIIKEKTDLELEEIIRKQRGLPERVVELAKTELERRSKKK